MKILHLFSKSRGLRNLVFRVFTVLWRFGISPKRFERRLQKYYEISRDARCLPTFAITAVILARHPRYIQELSARGVEFAVHGYAHIDYKVLAITEKVRHFRKAMAVFHRYNVPFSGFRAPFLRVQNSTSSILGSLGFLYHSSRVVQWPVIDIRRFPGYNQDNYRRLQEFCLPLDAEKSLSLPKSENGLIEIPVSLPDDETIIERLGITDGDEIAAIWQQMLDRVYEGGELFVLSLHPERIDYCEAALRRIIRKAREFSPGVWVATMKEIAEWWREKESFGAKVTPMGKGRYQVQINCPARATVLVRNASVNVPCARWFGKYHAVEAREFVVESEKRPVIGVSPDSSAAAMDFLKSEGYIVEKSNCPDDYGVYLADLAHFGGLDEKPLSRALELSETPLVRCWRWPDRARCAFSITGDIDAMTVVDFVLRIFESGWVNWRSRNRRQKPA